MIQEDLISRFLINPVCRDVFPNAVMFTGSRLDVDNLGWGPERCSGVQLKALEQCLAHSGTT